MATEKKEQPGFMLYADTWGNLFEDFSHDEAGKLLEAAIKYFQTGAPAEFDDRAMRAAFRTICSGIDQDRQRYARSILQRKFAAFKARNKAEISFDQWAAEISDQEE